MCAWFLQTHADPDRPPNKLLAQLEQLVQKPSHTAQHYHEAYESLCTRCHLTGADNIDSFLRGYNMVMRKEFARYQAQRKLSDKDSGVSFLSPHALQCRQ